MARKSSKTAHVMNLLSGGEAESSKSEAAKENLAASQAAESNGTIKELTVLAQQASIQMQEGPLSPSPISIIDLSSSVQDPVAELIRQQLEEDEKGEDQTFPHQDGADYALTESAEDSVSDIEEPDWDEAPATLTEELPVTEPVIEPSDPVNTGNELSNSDELNIDEDVTTVTPDTDEQIQHSQEPIQTDIHDTESPDTPALPNFKYLNVMEHVVENIAKDYMERLGGCICPRCIADVIALTLTKLPPKYVVVEPPAASPLLNFYSSRFAPQVIVEVTKSCFTVKENPHH
jgi:competence protein ComFB